MQIPVLITSVRHWMLYINWGLHTPCHTSSHCCRSAASIGGGDVGGGAGDLLEQNQSMQAGLFGVLYTLAKEKFDSSKRWAIARLVLDFIQCFVLVVRPSLPWSIDESNM
jgi:hypothetical protein